MLASRESVSDTELVAIADTEMSVKMDAQVPVTTTPVAENPNPTLQQELHAKYYIFNQETCFPKNKFV